MSFARHPLRRRISCKAGVNGASDARLRLSTSTADSANAGVKVAVRLRVARPRAARTRVRCARDPRRRHVQSHLAPPLFKGHANCNRVKIRPFNRTATVPSRVRQCANALGACARRNRLLQAGVVRLAGQNTPGRHMNFPPYLYSFISRVDVGCVQIDGRVETAISVS